MHKRNFKWFIQIFVLIITIVGLMGCDEDVVSYDYSISWTMDNLNPGENAVFLAASESDPDELVLAVDLNRITNGLTHGVYFDLVFRDEVIYFDGFSKGSVLEGAGTVFYSAALDSQDSGRVIVGVSLTGDSSVENADGILIRMCFKPLRSGTCPISFENARIMTAQNGGTYPVTGVSWYGGYATILE